MPASSPCPTDVPAKYACSVESAKATGTPVSVWVMHATLTCPAVQRTGYELKPLDIDATSHLGQWYHTHGRDLWAEGYRTSLSIVSNFLRVYVLKHCGGGTYLDLDVHILDQKLFNALPESVAAQEQITSIKFHGLHRFNNAFLRLRNTSMVLQGLETDWTREWSYKGNHRGYTGKKRKPIINWLLRMFFLLSHLAYFKLSCMRIIF